MDDGASRFVGSATVPVSIVPVHGPYTFASFMHYAEWFHPANIGVSKWPP